MHQQKHADVSSCMNILQSFSAECCGLFALKPNCDDVRKCSEKIDQNNSDKVEVPSDLPHLK